MPCHLRLLLLPLLLLLVSPVWPRDQTVLYKGREYLFRDAMRPFDEVQAWCHERGGYLPSVRESEDMIFLNKFAGSERYKWLGGGDVLHLTLVHGNEGGLLVSGGCLGPQAQRLLSRCRGRHGCDSGARRLAGGSSGGGVGAGRRRRLLLLM